MICSEIDFTWVHKELYKELGDEEYWKQYYNRFINYNRPRSGEWEYRKLDNGIL
jgi:hypothetical protein